MDRVLVLVALGRNCAAQFVDNEDKATTFLLDEPLSVEKVNNLIGCQDSAAYKHGMLKSNRNLPHR
jgi:hypothetical protein